MNRAAHLTPIRHLCLACVAATLAACTPALKPSAPGAVATPTPPTKAAMPEKEQTLYTIDPAQTQLHLLVYKAGTLARLGHNHVISSRSVRGNVWLGDSAATSAFEIQVPVNELIVDDEAARQAEGEDFPPGIQQAAKDGTKANMLRDNLLDGEHFPLITLQSSRIEGSWTAATVQAYMRIKDHTRTVSVPVQVERQGATLRVSGEFKITQTEFGITPMSVAMGALQVQNAVTIKFKLLARQS